MKKTLKEKIIIFIALNLGLLVIGYILIAFIVNSFDIMNETDRISRLFIVVYSLWVIGFVNHIVNRKLED